MQPFCCFPLVGRILGRETEHVVDSEPFQLGEVIAERTTLGSAATRPGDHVPPVRVVDTWPPGPWVSVNNASTRQRREIDGCATGCLKGYRCQARANEMA